MIIIISAIQWTKGLNAKFNHHSYHLLYAISINFLDNFGSGLGHDIKLLMSFIQFCILIVI